MPHSAGWSKMPVVSSILKGGGALGQTKFGLRTSGARLPLFYAVAGAGIPWIGSAATDAQRRGGAGALTYSSDQPGSQSYCRPARRSKDAEPLDG